MQYIKPTLKLYEIGQDMEALDALVQAAIENETIEDALVEVEGFLTENLENLKTKSDSYIAVWRRAEARAEFLRAQGKPYADEAKRYADKAKVQENLAKRLRDTLKSFFERHEMDGVTTDHHTVTIATNGGALKPVIDHDVPTLLIPEEFLKKVIDEDAVAAALAAGQELPFAHLPERGTHLRIK